MLMNADKKGNQLLKIKRVGSDETDVLYLSIGNSH